MKEKRALGFYFIVLAGILAVVSIVRFLLWAPAHNSMDYVIVVSLIAGVLLAIILTFKDNAYLVILSTACYSIAGVKVLTNSVGSFVDAIQGINMFGDATQVGTIGSIAAVIFVSIVLSISAGFLRRAK